MSAICLIDTSIFLNILNVPNRCSDRKRILEQFKEYIDLEMVFILPMAVILETGNHIAQNGDGGTRRTIAENFCKEVRQALNGEAPYRISNFPKNDEVLCWLDKFPDLAGKNKTPTKQEGVSFGDLNIIQEYEKTISKFSMSEVFIWSLDSEFDSYHYNPPKRAV